MKRERKRGGKEGGRVKLIHIQEPYSRASHAESESESGWGRASVVLVNYNINPNSL